MVKRNITKNDLAGVIAALHNVQKGYAKEAINIVFSSLAEVIKKMEIGERVEIRGFGVFEMREVSGYIRHRTVTGRSIVAPRRRIKYKPSKLIKLELIDLYK